jgi:hypothetical protein
MEPKDKEQYQHKLKKLISQMKFFKFLSIFFLTAAVLMAGMLYIIRDRDDIFPDKAKHPPPYYREITSMMRNLRYSGKEMFLRPDVRLTLDPQNKLWILHNVYSFDEHGGILLEKGTSGTCKELSVYMADKIMPLLGDDYRIAFVRTAYSAYFLGDYATHIVIKIYPKSPATYGEAYILDPSFKRYGPISDFEDYFFYAESPQIKFAKEQNTDLILPVNHLIPLFIKSNVLIGLVIEDTMGIFDKDNFAIALTATRRHRYAGRYIFGLRKYNGKKEIQENKMLADNILSSKEYDILKDRVMELFENVEEIRR